MPDATYHEQTMRNGATRYVCDICDDWWTRDTVLMQQHQAQQHQGAMVAGEPTEEPGPDEQEKPDHPHGTPPGHGGTPPGHGGTPPGQGQPDEGEPSHPITEPGEEPHPEHPETEPGEEPHPEHPVTPPPAPEQQQAGA